MNRIKLSLGVFVLIILAVSSFAYAAAPKLRVTPLPGTVTLMFDDGPHPSITPKVLAILKRYHVKANFSLLGYRAERYPELVKQITRQGNVLLIHTLQHVGLQNALPKTIRYEIAQTQKILTKLSGTKVYCVQPPFTIKSYKLGLVAKNLGVLVIPKAYDSYDTRNISVKNIIRRVSTVAHSGAIIYMHDSNTRTLLALPEIIRNIKAKGLGFSTICVPQR